MFRTLRLKEGRSCQMITIWWWVRSDGREACRIDLADPKQTVRFCWECLADGLDGLPIHLGQNINCIPGVAGDMETHFYVQILFHWTLLVETENSRTDISNKNQTTSMARYKRYSTSLHWLVSNAIQMKAVPELCSWQPDVDFVKWKWTECDDMLILFLTYIQLNTIQKHIYC